MTEINDLMAALEAARAERDALKAGRDQYRDQSEGLRLTLDTVRAERDSVRVLGNETYHCLKACEADRDAARAALIHACNKNAHHYNPECGCRDCIATAAELARAKEAGRG